MSSFQKYKKYKLDFFEEIMNKKMFGMNTYGSPPPLNV
jgi:hypothetical protein